MELEYHIYDQHAGEKTLLKRAAHLCGATACVSLVSALYHFTIVRKAAIFRFDFFLISKEYSTGRVKRVATIHFLHLRPVHIMIQGSATDIQVNTLKKVFICILWHTHGL